MRFIWFVVIMTILMIMGKFLIFKRSPQLYHQLSMPHTHIRCSSEQTGDRTLYGN